MLVLGIETSCDETAAAVVENGRSLKSNVVFSQIDQHEIYGGVVPEIASRSHAENIGIVVKKALTEADTTFDDIDAIAVTYSPGLIGALLVGVNFAKGVAFAKNKPLVPVHHLRGHIASNYLVSENLEPPFLCLVVSGGHSHIVKVNDYTQMEIIGKTLDDAVGEVFDKVARCIGLCYPGGIKLDKLAETGNENAYKLPHPNAQGKYNFSFSGLKTSVINIVHNAEQKKKELSKADLAASFRKTAVDYLCEKFIKSARDLDCKKLVLAGGVSANSLLRAKLTEICEREKRTLYMPPLFLCGDNASMIASQGYYEYKSGNIASLDLNAYATMPIDKPIK